MARCRRARFWSMGPPQAGSISEMCQVTEARSRRARFWSICPPQAGLILEYGPAAGGLDFGDVSSDSGPRQAGSILEICQVMVARRRRARFWSICPPQAGSISEMCQVTVARRRRA